MSIDRHNYEEFFILYWDDELTASQKQAVENFVKENSDLQEEFKILGETRFTPDATVQFEEKEFLQNKPFINITNYEEQLLNYIDDELSSSERREVETSAAKYPTIQKELALLQKAKLQPDEKVVFHDKSTLYKREEKVRVISMTWFRVAVAAVIILIAGFVTLRLINTGKSGDKNEVVKNGEIKVQPANQSSGPQISIPEEQTPKEEQASSVKNDKKSTITEPTNEKKSKKSEVENNIVNSLATTKPGNKNNLPREGKRPDQTLNEQDNTNDIASVDMPNNQAVKTESNTSNNLLDNSSVTKSVSPSFANISDEVDKLGKEEKAEKGGLKEFLRKTTRVFERRTKIQTTTDDNKLLLGAFAVSLK